MDVANGGTGHAPVMLERVVALLSPALTERQAVHVDATIGLGGHAEALLVKHPTLRVVGIDRDEQALERSRRRLARYGDRVTLVHAIYDQLPSVLAGLGHRRVRGVLFDLGLSSLQVDMAGRGFAYSDEGPLDMRMDQSQELTADQVVNGYPAERLARVLRTYGEERFARRIADAVARERTRGPITSTRRLSDIVRGAVPAATRRTGGHPAKRTFQALRIEVNGELAALERALPAALDALALGGRIVALSYQSLEDRLVKRELGAWTTDTTPRGLPVALPGRGPRFRLLTRGAERPGEDEVADNPRAASARLRAAERVREAEPADAVGERGNEEGEGTR
ncbi:MAG: 16S rRNA (cytosine(1402)-N(4))-methyltransferase RsmH [Streptosporangiales bacterium]|nr:16S rRNA (cytosine(1402)-N(4))-methyltransferase RsmH [Streptosporangiales bacterium]